MKKLISWEMYRFGGIDGKNKLDEKNGFMKTY